MKITIGSKNPVKINAVKEAFEMFFDNVDIATKEAESGVPSQPKNIKEIVNGAKNRARNSFNNCDLSVGVEAGIFPINESLTGYMDVCAIAIYDGKDFVGIGFSPSFEYPPSVIKSIFEENMEVSDIFDRIFNKTNTKHKEGAVGILSHGKYTRKDFIKAGVIMALYPLLNQEHYKT